jgi:hypothetical protein
VHNFARINSFPQSESYFTGDHSSHFSYSFEKLYDYLYKEVNTEKLEIRKILEDIFLDMYSHMLKLEFPNAAEIFFESYFT